MAAGSSSKRVVYAALIGNLLVAATKFVAAAWTGSAAMLSEGIHSVVDTSNQALLLYGMHRARQPPDRAHPFGHGRELYFWSLIVALMMFALGAGFSLYEGILHILEPTPIENPVVSYVVLACSAVFEGLSWTVALKEFRTAKGRLGYFEAVRRSKNPPIFLVLFEDSAALIGLAIAFVGTFVAAVFDLPIADGAASIGIGLVLAGTAAIIARETKGLLIGEQASPEVDRSILQIAQAAPGIERANGLYTVQLGPEQIVATLSLEFCDDLTTPEIEARVADLERQIRDKHPDLVALFVKPQSSGTYRNAIARRFAEAE
jgi:cation diffusion facilitator family transporter